MHAQITKRSFYKRGGLSNTRMFRKQRGHSWTYWLVAR